MSQFRKAGIPMEGVDRLMSVTSSPHPLAIVTNKRNLFNPVGKIQLEDYGCECDIAITIFVF